MMKLWKWYENCLAVHPVKTQAISSGFLWGVGDIAAQSISHSTAKKHLHIRLVPFSFGMPIVSPMVYGSDGCKSMLSTALCGMHAGALADLDREFKVDWKRVAITSIFGFGFIGPVGHFWYEGMDRFIRHRLQLQPNSIRFVATKVAMDGLIIGPFDLFMFFTYMGFCSGKNAVQVKEDLKRDFLPALILEGGIWPIVQVANFRYVPVRYQLLYVNLFCLLDSAFLSWMEQQKDAPWKQWFASISSFQNPGHSR